MAYAHQAQGIRPPPLEIANIVGMIDQTGEVRVLVIDADRQPVLTALESAGGGGVGDGHGTARMAGGSGKPGQSDAIMARNSPFRGSSLRSIRFGREMKPTARPPRSSAI